MRQCDKAAAVLTDGKMTKYRDRIVQIKRHMETLGNNSKIDSLCVPTAKPVINHAWVIMWHERPKKPERDGRCNCLFVLSVSHFVKEPICCSWVFDKLVRHVTVTVISGRLNRPSVALARSLQEQMWTAASTNRAHC